MRHSLRTIVSAGDVRSRIAELADTLARDYAERRPLVVVIAEGARRFAGELADGMRTRGVEPDLLYVRAERTRGTALGDVRLEPIDPRPLARREVLVVDDIADEGRTLQAVLELVAEGAPRSCAVAVLVDKRERRRADIPIDYVGFEIKQGWVVGFGMDLDQRYRELDHLALAIPLDP